MERPGHASRLQGIVGDVLLFLLGGLVIFTAAAFPTDWDACQFVLGLNRFSPPDHQPHPPGYLLFLLLARCIRFAASDPHRALTISSALAAALLPVAVRRLTAKMFPMHPDICWGAGLLALAAPTRLFFGSQALAYTWEGLLATLLISLALDLQAAKQGRWSSTWLWMLWVALWGVAGGFRPNLLLLLLPLLLMLSRSRRWWENLSALAVLGVITLSWIAPTAQASGGFWRYFMALRGHSAYFLYGGLGWDRILDNANALLDTWGAITGLHLVGWVALALICRLVFRNEGQENRVSSRDKLLVFWWFGIPMLLFHLLVFYTIRYSLLYIPLLPPLSAGILRAYPRVGDRRIPLALVIPAAVCLVSWWAFLAGDGPHSLVHLRSFEHETRHVADSVRALGKPESVTVVTGRRFRTWGIALPEYTVYFPMHALYAPELHPRLAAMRDWDTIRGDFYLPNAPESENVLLPALGTTQPRIVVLDEDALRALNAPDAEWKPVRITSRENLYWRSFPGGCLLMDVPGALAFLTPGTVDAASPSSSPR